MLGGTLLRDSLSHAGGKNNSNGPYRSLTLPIGSIVVPFFGLTKYMIRILQDDPQKELQWRL